MKRTELLAPVLRIAKYTVADEMRQRSLIVMFILCILGIFSLRSCYQGQYMVNGQLLAGAAIARQVSNITFHIIAVGSMFITALITMRAFRSDRDSGMQSCILSKPIDRRQYVAGKILGFWSLSFLFMFTLHTLVCIIASINMQTFLAGYFLASLLCAVNLLFVILAVLLLSLLLPDVVAFLCALGIVAGGWIADLFDKLSHNPMTQAMLHQAGGATPPDLTGGKILYYLWPKIAATQQWAASLLESTGWQGTGSLYPFFNVLLYCLILTMLLSRYFRKEEIV
jgi:ABC-type transport system involved in cytochrome c biogenesis permease component